MARQNIFIVICALLAIVLVLWLVIPDRDQRAQSAFDSAYSIEQTGELDAAVELYRAILRDYDGTPAAVQAVQSIERVAKLKDRQLMQKVTKEFGRVFLVLNGYKEMMGHPVKRFSDLDGGGYMFDSEYLTEIVPDGYTFFLRFVAGGGYELYSHQNGADKVIKRYNQNTVSVMPLAEFEKELAVPGYEKVERGRMVFLQTTL